MKTRWMILLLSLVLLGAGVSQVEACPNCSRAVGDNDEAEGANVGAGYSYSIYFMMSVPYMILGTVGVAGYRSFSSAMKKHEAEYYAQNGLEAPQTPEE